MCSSDLKVLIGQAVKVRCVCIDNQLIQTNIPKCDEVLFSDTKFVYVEAKIRVSSGSTNILKEINDAIKNKIPRTHDIIHSRMDGEFSVRHIEILIAMRQQAVIRISRQQEQQLLNEAKKHVGAFIKHVLLQEVIEF